MLGIKTTLTPVNTVIAPFALVPSTGYDSRHLCQIPLTLNFGMNSTFNNKIRYVTTKSIGTKLEFNTSAGWKVENSDTEGRKKE
jgi:hypothetical protein